MLIIIEGLDKSGKSTLVKALTKQHPNAILLKKSYIPELEIKEYYDVYHSDWQVLLDRVVFANPDKLFIADRSFITAYGYYILDQSKSAEINKIAATFEKYAKALSANADTLKTLIVYCKSSLYEYDDTVQNQKQRREYSRLYDDAIAYLGKTGIKTLTLDNSELTMQQKLQSINSFINN